MIHLPLVVVGGLGFAGYAAYRAFGPEKRDRSSTRNGWQNEAWSKSEKDKRR